MRSIRTLNIAIAAVLAGSVLSGATYTVTNTNDSGSGSLRQAITDANGTPGVADIIEFKIPGSGVQTIVLATPLPDITDDLEIHGFTQPGSSPNTNGPGLPDDSVHLIEIDGTSSGGGVQAGVFRIAATADFTIDGLVINRAPGAAIQVNGATGTVSGCFLGTDPTGVTAHPNGTGVEFDGVSGSVQIGGTLPAQRNVISGNSVTQIGFGCWTAGNTGHTIQGNFIGPAASGTATPAGAPAGNQNGVSLCFQVTNVTIGGATAGARNVISGNNGDGVIDDSGLPNDGGIVRGNKIGTDVSGTNPLPNSGWGLHVYASGLQIGGTGAGEANVIAYNGTTTQGGVWIEGGTLNAIRANSIHDNQGLGIRLSGDDPTPNDEGDVDTGPNNLQNFPVLATVTPVAAPTGGTRVQGVLHSAASTIYSVDFFSNDACLRFPKDFLEGRTYLGSDTVTTDAFGEGPIDTTLPMSIAPGERVSMTATDPAGNTSEFSQRLPFSMTPTSGPPAGGTGISISGTDFEGPATVTVGGQPATNIVVVDFNHITATTPALAAGAVYDVTVMIPEGVTGTLEKGWVADFLDVPPANQFYSNVTTLVSNAITVGIGPGLYGVDNNTLRQQMAVFLLKGKHGICYTPPQCVGRFPDVPCPSTFANWIEALAAEGIATGCGGGNFCPQNPVRRDQAAVFLLKAEHGSSYVPPPCNGDFPDVPCPSAFADWIEQLNAEGITGGCGGGNYCPLSNNTRGQTAVFIVKTFKLQ